MKRAIGIIGVIAVVLGMIAILFATDVINLPVSVLGTIPQGNIGIRSQVTEKTFRFLDTVAPGSTYEWKVTVKNTGTVTWTTSNVDIRVGIAGATVVDKTAEWLVGTMKVFQCSAGTDVPACSEDLLTNWAIKMNENYPAGSWITPTSGGNPDTTSTCRDNVCFVYVGALSPNQEKTVGFRITVPTTVTTSTKMILNSVAKVGAYQAIASDVRDLTYGQVSGTMTVVFVGVVAVVLGLLALLAAFL